MPLIVITGFKGAGKTAYATQMAWDGYNEGRKIMANYKLEFPFDPIDVKKLIENPEALQDAVMIIDESQLYFDSRMSGSKRNRLFSYIMLQSRKRKLSIILTTQQMSNIDIRLRKNVDLLLECSALVKAGGKKLRPASIQEIEAQKVDYIRVVMTDYSMGYRKERVYDPHPMFTKYNSEEFVDIVE